MKSFVSKLYSEDLKQWSGNFSYFFFFSNSWMYDVYDINTFIHDSIGWGYLWICQNISKWGRGQILQKKKKNSVIFAKKNPTTWVMPTKNVTNKFLHMAINGWRQARRQVVVCWLSMMGNCFRFANYMSPPTTTTTFRTTIFIFCTNFIHIITYGGLAVWHR